MHKVIRKSLKAETNRYNGIYYDSKAEAAYAKHLDKLLKDGGINGWKRQVKQELRVNGQWICNYYIDFVIEHTDGSEEYVEIKGGGGSPIFRFKWRLFEALNEVDTLTVIRVL